jgi:hypothetical protein
MPMVIDPNSRPNLQSSELYVIRGKFNESIRHYFSSRSDQWVTDLNFAERFTADEATAKYKHLLDSGSHSLAGQTVKLSCLPN